MFLVELRTITLLPPPRSEANHERVKMRHDESGAVLAHSFVTDFLKSF